MVVGKRITWYTDILRWGRNWVCSGLSLGFIHGTWQRSRVSDLDYDCVAEFTTYNYIYMSNIMICCSNTVNTLFLGWLLFFFPFCFAIAGSFKIGDDAHDHAWSPSRHANICCFRSHFGFLSTYLHRWKSLLLVPREIQRCIWRWRIASRAAWWCHGSSGLNPY